MLSSLPTSEQLLFILEIVTTQFLVLPQQPSSLLPVSAAPEVKSSSGSSRSDVCVCVLAPLGLVCVSSCSPQTLQFLRTTVERIKCEKLLTRSVTDRIEMTQEMTTPLPCSTPLHRCTPPLLGNMLSCLLACDVCSRQSEPQGVRKQGKHLPSNPSSPSHLLPPPPPLPPTSSPRPPYKHTQVTLFLHTLFLSNMTVA